MRKSLGLALGFVCMIFLSFPVFAGDVAAGTAAQMALSAAGAKGAVMMEAASGRVLYEKDSHLPLPMASTTKIMTALITLEQEELDVFFVVDSAAIHVEGTSMGLVQEDQTTLRTLAWGMLLASGNDAANAAAFKISGSSEAFCQLMNQKADELGMRDTVFESPSGLDVGDHHSTAYDMALLARAALENDDFSQIVRAKSAQVCYGNPPYHRWLTNHNRLLWQCDDCIGLKTGFTKKAGRCLVSAAQRDGLTLIAVTLGCPNDFTIHHDLYDRCFASLSFFNATDHLSDLSIPITGASEKKLPVKALWPLGAYLVGGESALCRVSLTLEPFVYAPVAQGRVVGSATLLLDGRELAWTPLVAAEERLSRFTDTRSLLQKIRDFFDHPEYYRFPLNERVEGASQ
ncbi:MAG: D-alanyl-D-alanine carboxypeptidase family protein [Oscillospiraceae bacterium]